MFFSISRNSLLKMLLLYLRENRLLNRLESLENRPFQTLLCLMGGGMIPLSHVLLRYVLAVRR